MSLTRHFLSPSVHWRIVNERCVILDVASDCYLQVSAEQFSALLPFVDPTVSGLRQTGRNEIPAELTTFAGDLLAANVLTTSPVPTPRIAAPSLPKPTSLVSTVAQKRRVKQALPELAPFLRACIAADYYLRSTSLSRFSAHVSKRKLKLAPKAPSDSLDREVKLTRIYHSLRPFYPRDYLCLFDSLALIEFLAHWNIFPNWVFGVIIDPFTAHCWVQDGSVVLSDTASFSSRWFEPIMIL
jgi:hypothetical protein